MARILSALLIPLLGILLSWASAALLPEAHIATGTLIGSAFLHVGAGVVFFTLVDQVVMRDLNLPDLLGGTGAFATKPWEVRREFVRGYFLLAAAIILAFAWAGV